MLRSPSPPANHINTINQGINTDLLDAETISELVDNTKNSLDELTRKADKHELSLLEQAQKSKNFALLNSYYQRAVQYYKNSKSGEIDTTTIDGVSHRRTILFWAIATFQNASVIEALIAKGSDADETYYDDNYKALPAFTIALTLGNIDAIRVLLTYNKALVMQKVNEFGATPAHYAVEQDKPEILEELFKTSSVITRVPIGSPELTPLHTAAKLGRISSAKWLLDHDNTVCNLPDNVGNTALHFAVMDENKEMVSLLLKYGANTSLVTRQGNQTALQLAAKSGNNEITQLLLQHGATPDKDHPVDLSNLNELLRIAFALHDYKNDRKGKSEYLNTIFGYNVNPKAWPRTTKVEMANAVYENIVKGLPPLSNLDPEKVGALKDGDLGIIAKSLFAGSQSPRVSPIPSPIDSPSASPTRKKQ